MKKKTEGKGEKIFNKLTTFIFYKQHKINLMRWSFREHVYKKNYEESEFSGIFSIQTGRNNTSFSSESIQSK